MVGQAMRFYVSPTFLIKLSSHGSCKRTNSLTGWGCLNDRRRAPRSHIYNNNLDVGTLDDNPRTVNAL